jgi:hypothetical protein
VPIAPATPPILESSRSAGQLVLTWSGNCGVSRMTGVILNRFNRRKPRGQRQKLCFLRFLLLKILPFICETQHDQLLSATNVIGPYRLVSGSASPYTNEMRAEKQRFFMLQPQ